MVTDELWPGLGGLLDGGPGRDGLVYFDEASIDAYLDRHGYGGMSETSEM